MRLPHQAIAALLLTLLTIPVLGHPVSDGALDIEIYPDRVEIQARVTADEVRATDRLVNDDPPATQSRDALFQRHAAYLVQHLHVTADGRPLKGRVVDVQIPAMEVSQFRPTYQFVYPIEGSPPKQVQIAQDVLAGVVSWEMQYIARIRQHDGPGREGDLLTSTRPITFSCTWDKAADVEQATAPEMKRAAVFGDFVVHGINHILTGYDHILFVTALVLAATSLWDLVKVVTAFTLAHTLTLTLSALHVVNMSSRIIEPLIAASIVFVAMQNIFWPKSSRGWIRLAAAFFFGLFHGLGFAGGLLDAMREMSTSTAVLAILAFSIGVELGHQFVILPLFGILTALRHTRDDAAGRDAVSLGVQRYGSVLISLAGMAYLVAALRTSIGGT